MAIVAFLDTECKFFVVLYINYSIFILRQRSNSAGKQHAHVTAPERRLWVQVARGAVTLNGERLDAGDGAALRGVGTLTLSGDADSDVLLFDMAA